MNAGSIYTIKKHPKLFHRFPSIRQSHTLDARYGVWLLFGPLVSQVHLNALSDLYGYAMKPLTAWNVGPYDVLLMRGELTLECVRLCDLLGLDCACLNKLPVLFEPGIALFDMDSTAIQMECIDEIAKIAGVGKKVADLTERAMLGELDFEESLRARVATLKGTDEKVLDLVKKKLKYTPGMRQLTASLQARGWRIALASGGFTFFSDFLKKDLSLDFSSANQLEIKKGRLTGCLIGELVDAQSKADILYQLSERYEIPMTNTLAVGDGANDLSMMSVAGLGVAYHAKPKVKEAAQVSVSHADLGGVLCVLSASLLYKRLSW